MCVLFLVDCLQPPEPVSLHGSHHLNKQFIPKSDEIIVIQHFKFLTHCPEGDENANCMLKNHERFLAVVEISMMSRQPLQCTSKRKVHERHDLQKISISMKAY